ncbi:paraquat-inducible protein A [Thalassotalea sp. M1531]|uniref:Paraquat-inducible protein A n=1 Tax=Thalassotalea algicola TaxID=2716224 RepID=A0A7Y0Q6B4_9GAMM|nr:paraquat-inducible protein A [Thalassotalea algicola]NMP30647.1 paraquat-inducible protein A [Thalassotalea algicola]
MVCKRCGAKLYECKTNSIDRTLALSLAGLILALPAMSLPIIGVGAVGLLNYSSLLECIHQLINNGYQGIALCIFLFTIAIPVVRLFAATYITWSIKFNRVTPALLNFFRSYHQLDSWTMLHVFLLGIVVSMYKLVDLAELHVGVGFIAFVSLLICSTTISVTLDHHLIWDRLEQSLDE